MKTNIILLSLIALIVTGCAISPAKTIAPQTTPPTVTNVAIAEAPVQVEISTPTTFVVEAAPNTPEPSETPAPAVKNPNDQCDNPYFPVVDGASWTYTNNSIGQFTHTLNVSLDQLFIIQVTSGENTFTIEGQCLEEGVVLMNTGLTTTAQSDGSAGSVTTINQEGVTLPNDVQLGDDWTQVIAYQAGSAEGVSFSGTIETNYKAVAYELVTVPAGTFEALRIEQNTTMTMSGNPFKTSSILWYAQGIGNVKTELIAFSGEPSVSELVTYNIP